MAGQAVPIPTRHPVPGAGHGHLCLGYCNALLTGLPACETAADGPERGGASGLQSA